MKLREVATVRTGLVLSRKEQREKTPDSHLYRQLNLRCIRQSGEIDEGQLDNFLASERLKSEYLTQINDVIVRLSQPYTAVFIDKGMEGIVISSHFVIIKPNQKVLLSQYLNWLLNTEECKRDIMQRTSGNMLGTIRPSFFSEFIIKLPSLKKQKIIGEIYLLAKKESSLLIQLCQLKEKYYKSLASQINEQSGGNKNDNKK